MSNDLEDQLRAGGAKVSEGVFRVDARRALSKLREFRLAEPHHWVLEVLRAASSSKARSVDVETDTDDIIIRFDGAGFSPEVMKDLLAQALDSTGQGDRRSARYLSLGIAGALGLNPKWIKIRSGSVALEILPPDNVTISPAKEQGTFIHVRKRFGWSVIKAAIADVSPEERAIEDRAQRYGPTLTLNKHRVDGGKPFKGGFVVSSSYEGEGMELHVGVPVEGLGGKLVLDVEGVVVARRELQVPGRFIAAWARCDRMRRNASGSDVVDSDAAVQAVFKRVRALALEVTKKMGVLLAEGKVKAAWRDRYRAYAIECFSDDKLDPEARPLLADFPIIPGVYEEWFTPNDFEREHKAGKPVYFCTQAFPRGSYPTPIVRFEDGESEPLRKLLPAKRLVDAAGLVRAKARAAQAKHRWLSSPIEDRALPTDKYLARMAISGPNLSGEVGLVDKRNAGAFVRFLCQGRFVQQGDVASLAPFRLRAVINWQKDVPEKLWHEIPSDKLWSLALDAIEAAAQKAVLACLSRDRGIRAFEDQAHDLLVRRANAGATIASLPLDLRLAPIFELTGGEAISLEGLAAQKTWKYVHEPVYATLLSGDPVMILSSDVRSALTKLAPKRLEDVRERLELEREVRARINQPRKKAELGKLSVVVDIEADGMTGQVGVPANADFGLHLTLLRDGFELERTSLTATYDFAHAIVECRDFAPNDDWDTAVRNETFDRALAAVRVAEEKLAGAIIEHSPGALDALSTGYQQFLVHFMRKHLKGTSDPRSPTAARVENAQLFRTRRGTISLAEIRKRLAGEPRLWTLQQDELPVPASMFVLLIQPEQAALLKHLLDVRIEDATDELQRLQRRERYLRRPQTPVKLPPGATLEARIELPSVRGVIGLAQTDDREASIDVIVSDRIFTHGHFAALLPLAGALAIDGVDTADAELTPAARAAVVQAIALAEAEILRRAVASQELAASRRAARLAIQYQLDRDLPPGLGALLAALPLFPCTDGTARSASSFDGSKVISFVTRPIAGESASKEPVITAAEPAVKRSLARWSLTEDVTELLERELQSRAARAQIAPVKKVAFSGPTLWSRQIAEAGLEGELAIVADGGGRLTLLHERRPLAVMEGALPSPLAAVINCDRLTLGAFNAHVQTDRHYDALIDRLEGEAEVLLDRVADAVFATSEQERDALGPLLAPLTFWLVARKKRAARLVKMPLFQTSDGNQISLNELFDEQKLHKTVLWSDEPGAPLSAARWVWRPRAGEKEALQRVTKVKLKDATASIVHAANVRKRKVVTDLSVSADPKEKLSSERVQGEVGLHPAPSRSLIVELHREGTPLEQYLAEHPIGGFARINCDGLTPNADWSRAHRNLLFKQVMAEIEDAIERLVTARLQGTKDASWQLYADAAVRWKRGAAGPLAQLLPRLELFTALDGSAVTVGAVLEEHSRHGRVLTAEPGLEMPEAPLAIARSKEAIELLRALELKAEDTSAQLRRSLAIKASLEQRKLHSLEHSGKSIARLALNGDGLTGELVIVEPDEPAEIILAKDHIYVRVHALGDGLPIGGVVNVDGLEVNEDWTKAVVSRQLKEKLAEAVEKLLCALAASAPQLSTRAKHHARDTALRFLAQQGVTSASHLERMTGAAAALANAPLLLSEAGQWVPLTAVADQVLRTGWISIFEATWLKRDTLDDLVLRSPSLRDPWITALETIFGVSRIERVKDVALWRKQLAERDPARGTPEAEGLKRLRKQMRLLRAGALGHVTPDELDDVRVRADGAKAAITYDPARKLVLLDGSDPSIARALAEIPQRPERIYVLLAAIYGAVNRSLARISDADEGKLLTSLAAHIAANPKCLGPSEPE